MKRDASVRYAIFLMTQRGIEGYFLNNVKLHNRANAKFDDASLVEEGGEDRDHLTITEGTETPRR
ncbi:MAG: hypothetical protein JJU12_07650 [Chlamydiales bacterium]|nr:hypothetical protein [Chlamydiales bacterium]